MREGSGTVEARLDQLLALQSLLARVSREVGPALELQPVLQTVLTAMRSLVDFRGGTICLVDERGVYVAASDPPVTPDVAAARVPVGQGLAGTCVARGEFVYSSDLDVDPRVDQGLRRIGSNRDMRSYLGVPLVCLGEVIGVLQVDSVAVDAFDDDDRAVLEGLATQVAGAIESARRFEEMRRLEDARSMFLARVSHELRTPLTILRGFSSNLLERPEYGLGETARMIVERIDAASARLAGLVEELLTVSSVETGMLLVAQPSDVAIRDVLDDARTESLDPAVVTVGCPDGLRGNLDATLLRQALHLLLQNAIAYAGGAELEAGVGPPPDRRVWVAVVDHGPGIPDARKDVVFERFSRGEEGGPGWGLGLSVVRQLATAMGADIILSDTPGGGATFTLTMPAAS